VLTGREVCRVYKALATLDSCSCFRDASGTRVPGLNATVLMFHKPFAQQRASLVRAVQEAVPGLSGDRYASVLVGLF
jgi:hypothetical protein